MSNDLLKRFDEIKRKVAPDVGSLEAQKIALSKVRGWLAKGESDPKIVLRAAQVLLAEGESRLDAVTQAAAPLHELLVEESNAFTVDKELLLQKCFVLACWDEGVTSAEGDRILALVASPWWWVPNRPGAAQPWIEKLLTRCSTPGRIRLEPSPPVSLEFPAGKPMPSAPTFDRATFNNRLNEVQVKMTAGSAATEYVSNAVAVWRQLADSIDALRNSLNQPATAVADDLSEVQEAISAWGSGIRSDLGVLREVTGVEELLWWSHARYCYRHRKPLRFLSDNASKRWWAAYELAARVPPSQCEPAASLLVETLAALDVPWNETRTLEGWLEELHSTLRVDSEHVKLSPGLATAVRECAVGLPVTWVRAHLEKPFNPTSLSEEINLSLDREIQAWQWSSWLLRECLLERRIG